MVSKKISQGILSLYCCQAFCLDTYQSEVGIRLEENIVLEVDAKESFVSVVECIDQYLVAADNERFEAGDVPRTFRLDFTVSGTKILAKVLAPTGVPRDYFAAVSVKDKEDIRYILTTLANCSLIKIGTLQSSLKKAGDRIDHVHPLRFLTCVFFDEELKVCMRNVQGRSWVWDEFVNGLTSSLVKEAALGNVKIEYVKDLAAQVKIDPNLIMPSVQGQRWRELIDLLITNVPRREGANRYEM